MKGICVEHFEVLCGDCRDVMRGMDAASIDAIVTDPPYGLSFMGKGWDHGVPGVEFWTEAMRVAKPGAHLLAFGGTRTFHRLACAIEDASWEIRDTIMWVYGSGFPKSHDVSKAIDKAAGAEREVVGSYRAARQTNNCGTSFNASRADEHGRTTAYITAPTTDAAKQWHGWGTALKPAWEPIIVARKPLDGTVAENALRHGTGAINVDGCRVGTEGGTTRGDGPSHPGTSFDCGNFGVVSTGSGRWPANLIHDGSDEVVAGFPVDGEQSASRFFYCAKASRADREEGLRDGGRSNTLRGNHHPTVKPTALMRYLIRLVTRTGGIVLDPFMGSGSTGKDAMLEGMRFIGIDKEAEYAEIARARIRKAYESRGLLCHAGG